MEQEFKHHSHPAVVHAHRHCHVTHNWSQTARTFEHLVSWHEHEHDHPAVAHEHMAHNDAESEHYKEAHDHDHELPVRPEVAATASKAVRAES